MKKNQFFLQKQTQTQKHDFLYFAISWSYKRISSFNNTRCKISARYILYKISGVDEKEDMNTLNLTNDINKDI